jgi:hypothetical protein
MEEDSNSFLSEYNESDINAISFILKLKTDKDYDTDTLKKYIMINRSWDGEEYREWNNC